MIRKSDTGDKTDSLSLWGPNGAASPFGVLASQRLPLGSLASWESLGCILLLPRADPRVSQRRQKFSFSLT